MRQYSIYILTVFLGLFLYSCSEQIEYTKVTAFNQISNSGVTDLDDKFTVSINVPDEVRTVEAIYYDQKIQVPLTPGNDEKGAFKTGLLEVKRSDIKTLNAAGGIGFVRFIVDGNPNNLIQTQLVMKSALTIDAAPKEIMRNDKEVKIKYSVKTAFPLTSGTVTVESKIDTANAVYTPYAGNYSISGGEIIIKGINYQVGEAVKFRVKASANGYESSTELASIKVTEYTFTTAKVATLVNDTTINIFERNIRDYVDNANKIVDKPITDSIGGTTVYYKSISVLDRLAFDSVIIVKYIKKGGGDSLVEAKFPAQALRVKYEVYTKTRQAFNLFDNKEVIATDPNANLILTGSSVYVTPGVTLVETTLSVFNSKKVLEAKELVQNPPIGSTIIAGGESINNPVSRYFSFSITKGGVTKYGFISFGKNDNFLKQVITVWSGE